jgi:Na+/proline symporter
MKAVLWTDTIQMVIIIAGLLTVLIYGSSVMGGFDVVWNIADNASRINLLELVHAYTRTRTHTHVHTPTPTRGRTH